MPKKAKASKADKAASDPAGEPSGLSSPNAAAASISFPSPSQLSEYDSSPDKARPTSRRRASASSSREPSQPIPVGPTYVQMSKGRVPINKIRLIDAAPDAAIENTMALKSSAAPARKAPSGASRKQKMRASLDTHAEHVPVDDQQTQDLAGQEAAPDMRFEVSIRTSRGHAHMTLCACTCT